MRGMHLREAMSTKVSNRQTEKDEKTTTTNSFRLMWTDAIAINRW